MIPFANLKAQYQSIKHEIDPAVLDVLASGEYILGPHVEGLEAEFAGYCGTEYAVAVNSGTSALHLALLASGVGAGDEVITTPLTFIATVAAIGYTGAKAVLADIDSRSFTIDPEQIERAITPRTKAIIPVHLYGEPADMAAVCEIANRHGITVIEDAAQSHGAEYGGARTGTLGDIAAFSFYPTKNLGTYGEGGMITTTNPELAQKVRRLRDWGQAPRSAHVEKGYNYRMDAIQGAILRVKLGYLDKWNALRRERAGWYDELLAGSKVEAPLVARGSCHSYHLYVVRSPERDRLKQSLAKRGIETAIHYRAPVHLQPAYSDLGYQAGDFPHAERASSEVLSLPMYPELQREQVEMIAAAIRES